MAPERWQRVKSLFDSVLDQPGGAGRASEHGDSRLGPGEGLAEARTQSEGRKCRLMSGRRSRRYMRPRWRSRRRSALHSWRKRALKIPNSAP